MYYNREQWIGKYLVNYLACLRLFEWSIAVSRPVKIILLIHIQWDNAFLITTEEKRLKDEHLFTFSLNTFSLTHHYCLVITEDSACRARDGTCQDDSLSCPGEYLSGLCSGASNRRCCIGTLYTKSYTFIKWLVNRCWNPVSLLWVRFQCIDNGLSYS